MVDTMDTLHPQVPVLGFQCDEDIAELIELMNTLDIQTIMSCQDNNLGRGTVRRIWVEIHGYDLNWLLEALDRPAEASDPDSLSGRIANEWEPEDQQDFRENRKWHYVAEVGRHRDQLMPLTISIRFPHTDLDEVITRLRAAAREIAGLPPEAAPDGNHQA